MKLPMDAGADREAGCSQFYRESPPARVWRSDGAMAEFQPSAPDLQMYLQSKEAGLCLISAILMWKKNAAGGTQ